MPYLDNLYKLFEEREDGDKLSFNGQLDGVFELSNDKGVKKKLLAFPINGKYITKKI